MDSSKENEVLEEGVQIASAGAEAAEAAAVVEGENDVGIELGDRILIVGGRYNNTRGRIYYLDDELIRIMPDGVSDRLIDIPIVDGGLDEDLGVDGIDILKKSNIPTFVEQNDLRVGQKAETFTALGDQVSVYTVSAVSIDNDTATLTDDTGAVLELEFEGQGIPKDAPFAVLRVQEQPKPVEEAEEVVEAAAAEEEGLGFELLEEIEIPTFDIIQEVPSSQRIYSDIVQKNDMLGDLIKGLDPVQQKNLRRVKVLRRLVENMVQLRNDISSYSASGSASVKEVAIQNLADLLEKTEFPLAKQVLAVARSLYLDHSEEGLLARKEGGSSDTLDSGNPFIQINYLQDAVEDGMKYMNAQMASGNREEVGGLQTTRSIPRWFRVWQGYFHEYYKVFPSFTQGDMQSTKVDKDFFRAYPPAPKDEEPTLPGLPVLGAKSEKTIITDSDIAKVYMSYVRTLGPRLARIGEKRKLQVVEDADEAEIYAYLLFPLFYIRDLGVQRSGSFILDVANGASAPKTMSMIIEESGGISDVPTATGIISVRPDGTTLGNILLSDWLKGQKLYGGGLGDLMPVLKSFGLSNTELTPEQKEVLDQKVECYYGAVKGFLKELREGAEPSDAEEDKTLIKNSLLTPEAETAFFETIQSEPVLQNALEEFQKRFPAYAQDDVARFSALYIQYADLLTSVLGGVAQNISVERNRVVRDQFLHALRDALAYQKKLASAGDAPTPNLCPHVESLDNIRKIKNDDDRMKILVKFLNDFRGDKRDHWIWCSVCNQHLLCEHEFLGIQEFLHPKEKDVLHKEVLLTFSGGEFQGKYMCRNCGQPISELDFDTSLEYDDEGRPMMGRSVLVDEDALMDEELAKALAVENEEKVKLDFKSEDRNLIYKTISELAALLGVHPDKDSYEKMIYRVQTILASKPDKKRYAEIQKKIQEQAASKGLKGAAVDFTIFINRALVSLCAGALLIDVQTHMPDYTIRYILEGCKRPEFIGFPRDTDNARVGIEYLSCAISTLCTKGNVSKGVESPWELTKFNAIRTDADRLKVISSIVEKETKELANIADVQQDIAAKKEYMTETFGAEAIGLATRPKDIIPEGFTPEQIVLAKSMDANVEQPIIDAAADPRQKARGWVLEGHRRARVHGKYFAGNPFSESSCCYSIIADPGEFWKTDASPLGPKEPPQGPRGSRLFVHMIPRPLEDLFGKTDASLMYRLFMRVCFRGPRVGLQHEPGYTLKCPYCELQFPEDPRNPPPVPRFAKDGGTQKRYDEEYKSAIEEREQLQINALAAQGVEVSQESFDLLLVESNRRFLVKPVAPPMIPSGMENLQGLLTLPVEPFEGYISLIKETILQLTALPPDADKAQKALAYGAVAEKQQTFEISIRARLGDNKARYEPFAKILASSPQSIGESLRSYFLIPLQRALSGFDVRRAMKVPKTYDLGSETVQDIEGFLLSHTDLIPKLSSILQDTPFLRSKVKELIHRLSIIIPLFTKVLRSNILPAGDVGFSYLQNVILTGIFAEFMDSNHIPPEDEADVAAPERPITEHATLPIQVFVSCLKKFADEGIHYTSEQIRIIIADRNEKEKAKIIRDIDTLDKEGKRLELLQKSLGLGRWAVGGTKVIWQYNEDQYVREKIERAAAGIQDFPMQGGEEYEAAGDGYDVVQTGEDDA